MYGWREREKMIDDVMESEVRDRKKWRGSGMEEEPRLNKIFYQA